MNVKGGTRTWSPAEQQSSLKADARNTMSAQDAEKVLGGQDMGELLNKVADPNWVDPAKARRVGNNQLDKDAFLKLMLAQMKNQDPTSPMQSHEMAAQLAQFTSLEQLSNINTTLEGMKSAQQPATNYQALNFIGKKVAGDSSKVVRMNGDRFHDFNFQLGTDASQVIVKVKDGDGGTVRTIKADNLKKGDNTIQWNGLAEDGTPARPGEYKLVAEGVSGDGGKVFVKSEFDGKITGMNFTPSGPVLLVGNQTVRLQDVKKIYEPPPEERSPDRAPITPLAAAGPGPVSMTAPAPAPGGDLERKAPAKPEDVPAASDDVPANGLTKNVAMSRGLMNQLAAGDVTDDGI